MAGGVQQEPTLAKPPQPGYSSSPSRSNIGQQRLVLQDRGQRGRLVIDEAKMGTDPGTATDRFYRAIEDVDEAPVILAMSVAAHGRLIDTELAATSRGQVFEFLSHDGQEGLGEGPAVRVLSI